MTETSAAPAATGGLRRGATAGLLWAMMAYLGLGVLQIFFAGFGVFDLNGAKLDTAAGDHAFAGHAIIGGIMALVALIGLVLALVARAGRTDILLTALLLVVVLVVQQVLAGLGKDSGAFWGGLHALFGIGSLGIASKVMADARQSLHA